MLSDVFFVPLRTKIGMPPEAVAALLIMGVPLLVADQLMKRGIVTHPKARMAAGIWACAAIIIVIAAGWGGFSLE